MKKMLSELKGFENAKGYELSSDGTITSYRVLSTDEKGRITGRVVDYNKGRKITGCLDSNGYRYLDLRAFDVDVKLPKVHRLIAKAFLENPNNKEQVNHIDGNKENNHVNNLEYVTNEENRRHALKTGLKKEIQYGISQYDLNGNLLNTFNTAVDALIFLGVENPKDRSGNIGRCIKGKRKTAYGYVWKQYEGSTTSRETYDISQ